MPGKWLVHPQLPGPRLGPSRGRGPFQSDQSDQSGYLSRICRISRISRIRDPPPGRETRDVNQTSLLNIIG